MAKAPGNSSWLVIEELLERGAPAFVDELRNFDDAERLALFASKWYPDRRPAARQLLLDYLDCPLNAYRHEPLVKRLFKLAENAGDAAVMGRFLVLLDRSVRRSRRRTHHFEYQTLNSEDVAQALIQKWQEEGAEFTSINEWSGRYHVTARWPIESVRIPRGTTMPRKIRPPKSLKHLPERLRRKLEGFLLFSVHTRHYLRRRAWRYFRKLGKEQPDRYVPAVVQALKLYQDRDVSDGLALIDNWGLLHILFHHSPVLVAKTNGWIVAEGRKLSELAPAPVYEHLWKKAPRALLELLQEARCRPVRQWAVQFLRRQGRETLVGLPLEDLLALLSHQDAEVAALATEALQQAPGLGDLALERWLALLENANAAALDVLCDLIVKHLQPAQVTLGQAAELAGRRPVPIARLGLSWLRDKTPTSEADCKTLLALTEAQSDSIRGDIVRWVRHGLSQAYFQPDWVLEFLDCRHADVRAEGWSWLQEEPRARDNVDLWRRLLESPYDDVRLKLVADLERRLAGRTAALSERSALDPEMVRFLWASVLLNIHRGNRAKPLVVGQMVRRLNEHPDDAPSLLPILSVVLRSIRGPEWRAGLTGVVQLLEQNPSLDALVRETFPELKCG